VLQPAVDAVASATGDPAELFDVDVHELAWPRALVGAALAQLPAGRPSRPTP
jgi:hypothetical protein